MKCPKCDYLGFETGDRCRNCGYDFSLIPAESEPSAFDADLLLRPPAETKPTFPKWDGSFDIGREAQPPTRTGARNETEDTLPLFSPVTSADSDEPLIKLPAAPRPPLAVRRTPETPKLRAVPKRPRPVEVEPALEFAEAAPPAAPIVEAIAEVRARTAARLASQSNPLQISGAGPRVAAAAIDHLLLGAVDVVVVYFTVRMAGLPMAGWTELPLAPLAAFLMLVKLSYFSVFTAVGGQTIGKMAARIRVVTEKNGPLDAPAAAMRSLAGTLSAVLLGLGYVPALLGAERRALHDRLTHTRVVSLPPA